MDIQQLQTDVQSIKTTLDQHTQELTDHKHLIESHGIKLTQLDQIVSSVKIAADTSDTPSTNRPFLTVNQPASTKLPVESPFQKHNVENFSQQEKRILAVFFQNPQMSLSYVDIAKALNKSANTIKNQLRQLSMKVDLFDKAIDNENRNRFKLKDGLHIEQYLNLD